MLENLLNQFLVYLELEKGLAQNTLRNYGSAVVSFLNITGVKKHRDIDEKSVQIWRTELAKNTKKNTQLLNLIAFRTFLKYLKKKQNLDVMEWDKIELPKGEQRKIEIISMEELKQLFTANAHLPRERTVLTVLFSTGLRIHELMKLPRDLHLQDNGYTIRGKGGKVRLVFFSTEAKEAINAYLAERKDTDTRLFPYSLSWVQQMVKKAAKRAGLSHRKIGAHALRHAFANSLLSNGTPIQIVSQLLGHSDLSTTMIYTHTSDKQLQEAHKNLPKI